MSHRNTRPALRLSLALSSVNVRPGERKHLSSTAFGSSAF